MRNPSPPTRRPRLLLGRSVSAPLRPVLAAGLAALLAVLLGGPLGGPLGAIAPARAQEDGPQGRPRVDAALQARIDRALERGAAWLKTQQRKDGSFPAFGDRLPANMYNPMDVGLNALAVQTLAHCGAGPDDDVVKRCLAFCRFHYSGGGWNLKGNDKVMVYTASTIVLALHALYAGAVLEEQAEVKRDRYGKPVPPRRSKQTCRFPAAEKRWIEELVEFLVRTQERPSGGWRYPGNPVDAEEGPTDLSNTQYALLALDVASRCGFKVPAETWKRAAGYVLGEQEVDGIEVPLHVENPAWTEASGDEVPRFLEGAIRQARGWCYLPGRPTPSTGSMTCAGITCLALAKERLWAQEALPEDLSRRMDAAMLDGLAWLSEHFTVEDNPDPPSMWHYYYLYGLERTGAKTGLRFLGTHDWYREGAEHLLAAQQENGGWEEAAFSGKPADSTESAITQTCFALLFLKRSTTRPVIPVTPPVTTGAGG